MPETPELVGHVSLTGSPSRLIQTPAPLHALVVLERAQPRGKLWGVACAFRRRAVVRLENRATALTLSDYLLSHKLRVRHYYPALKPGDYSRSSSQG